MKKLIYTPLVAILLIWIVSSILPDLERAKAIPTFIESPYNKAYERMRSLDDDDGDIVAADEPVSENGDEYIAIPILDTFIHYAKELSTVLLGITQVLLFWRRRKKGGK